LIVGEVQVASKTLQLGRHLFAFFGAQIHDILLDHVVNLQFSVDRKAPPKRVLGRGFTRLNEKEIRS
jgi:hypothetical protein